MTRSSRNVLGGLATVLAGLLSTGAACADAIFVTSGVNELGLPAQLAEYDSSGAVINPALIPGGLSNNSLGIAVSGPDIFVTNPTFGPTSVGEYTTGGALVNSLFGVNPIGLAVSGGDLFVLEANNTVGEYTTSLAPVNPTLIVGSGLGPTPGLPNGIAVSGSDIFVTNERTDTVSEYTTSGAVVNPSLIPPFSPQNPLGITSPTGIAVDGSDLFVLDSLSGRVGEYTTSGAMVNGKLISGLGETVGIAALGSDLFVLTLGGSVGEYTTSGAVVNADLVGGSGDPDFFGGGIAVAPTPEPSTFLLVSAALLAGVIWGLRRRGRAWPAKM